MNTNQFIFYSIIDIDHYIIKFLDPITDFITLSSVNKYYNGLVVQNKLFNAYKNFTMEMNREKRDKDFLNACTYGYLLVAQYFFNKYTIDIHDNTEHAFRQACYYNHIEIAEWLFKLGSDILSPINIHAYDEDAFKSACFYGSLEIVKWLYQLGNDNSSPIDIRSDNDFAFRWACLANHIGIAKWLCILCDKYKITIGSNGKIMYRVEI